jgi:hypothetical protein
MGGRKSKAWSFWWVCQHCDKLRRYLVNECPGDAVVWARCSSCTSLIPVTRDHRDRSVAASKG